MRWMPDQDEDEWQVVSLKAIDDERKEDGVQ